MDEDHKGFCIRSLHARCSNPEISRCENFDFAEALESVYPILEIIFHFLDYKDLRSCSFVKNSWKNVAEKELAKRLKPSWFTCYRTKGKKKTNVFKYSDELTYNNVGIGIVLYDFRRIKLSKFICLHKNTTELSRKSVLEYLEEELIAPNVEYCVLSCPNVVSYFDAKSKDINNVGLPSIMDGLFIPKIQNIRTVMFHCNAVRKEDIESTIRPFIWPNEEVKCLLMFSTKDLSKSLINLLKYLIPENEPTSVPIGGGIIRGTKLFQQNTKSKRIYTGNDIFCITFLKDKYQHADFKAYSFVIHGDDLSKEEFEAELKKFRLQIILRTHTIAIRVCCSAKVDFEDESLIFSNVFPNVPLLGFHADGEIGWNCLESTAENDYGGSKAKKSKHKYPKVQHQWSTVFVLISWGTEKM